MSGEGNCMEMPGPIDALRLEGITFLQSAARTRAEAVEITARFGTVLEAEQVNQALPDDPERTSDHDVAHAARDFSAERSVAALDLHTDSSQQDIPSTLISLYCEHSDASGGGATTWLHVDDLLNALESTEEGRVAHEVLASVTVPFAQSNDATPQLKWFPVLSRSVTGTTIRYAGSYIRFGIIAAEEAGRPVPTEAKSALDILQRTILGLKPRSRTLASGDIVVIDNHRVLHGRTAINDTATRLFWRVKLSSDAGSS
jgi:alpha-ketoglutarate-dependent taurine dioxygenase